MAVEESIRTLKISFRPGLPSLPNTLHPPSTRIHTGYTSGDLSVSNSSTDVVRGTREVERTPRTTESRRNSERTGTPDVVSPRIGSVQLKEYFFIPPQVTDGSGC